MSTNVAASKSSGQLEKKSAVAKAVESEAPTADKAAIAEEIKKLIFRPIDEDKKKGMQDVLLVFFPGALTPPEAYSSLVELVQGYSDLRLWASVVSFPNNIPTQPEMKSRYAILKECLQAMGYEGGLDKSVFIAGHSWGAWEGRAPALQLATGFIQICSWFDPKIDSLREYPKPVLTIGGENDGQTPIPLFSQAAADVRAGYPTLGEEHFLKTKPVVIIDGMNHAQVSHGKPNYERGDWEATIPIEVAKERLAEVMAAFLGVHAGEGGAKVGKAEEAALDVLRRYAVESKKWLDPFVEAMAVVKDGWESIQDHLLKVAGVEASGMKTKFLWYSFKDNFIYSKPFIDAEKETIICQAFLQKQGKFGLSETLWIKLKNPTAVQKALGLGGQRGQASQDGQPSQQDNGKAGSSSTLPEFMNLEDFLPRAAASVNEKIFETALSLCTDAVRKKYEERGRQVKFVDDKLVTNSMQWLEDDVAFNPSSDSSDVVEVVSPIHHTKADYYQPRFAGMYYMKVLTVSRAMEWIVYESFKK